eukprot:TRINITY_DN6009_c0_g1_i1.p1 TRINITY_DN6009_c0_g1~~TRINITY_DN6009_c0_g1_i1.p1  ORF type:complete len:313 (-),score=49.61 TRINITY_DN6009_c0_g1_i1:60-998(-)
MDLSNQPKHLTSLHCPLCYKFLHDPVTFSCGHSFCFECIHSFTTTQGNSVVICATCHTATHPRVIDRYRSPAENVVLTLEHLRNFPLNDLLRIVKSSSGWKRTEQKRMEPGNTPEAKKTSGGSNDENTSGEKSSSGGIVLDVQVLFQSRDMMDAEPKQPVEIPLSSIFGEESARETIKKSSDVTGDVAKQFTRDLPGRSDFTERPQRQMKSTNEAPSTPTKGQSSQGNRSGPTPRSRKYPPIPRPANTLAAPRDHAKDAAGMSRSSRFQRRKDQDPWDPVIRTQVPDDDFSAMSTATVSFHPDRRSGLDLTD